MVHGGYFEINKDSKWGVADSTGTVILPCKYEYVIIYDSPEHDILVNLNGLKGTFDCHGNQLIPIQHLYWE